MGSRRRTYTDLVDVISYSYVFQYKDSSGSWVNIGSNTSVNLGTVAASGGSSNISIRHYREKYVNGIFTSNEVADLSYSLPSGITKTQSGSVSNDYASIFRYSYGNNTSTSSRTMSMTVSCNGNKITTSMSQSAGSKQYGSWSSWSVSVSNNGSVAARGGSTTINRSASRYRVWTWNGVAGSGSTDYDYGTPQLSVTSGSGTLSGTTLSYGNNTSTSSRSTRVIGTYSGASDYTDVTQAAGSKQYGSWGSWTISLSASPSTIAASGGSSTISRSSTRTRTWTWNGVSGSGGTETDTGTPSLSKVSGNATLSGTTVSYSNNTSTSSRSSVIRATIDSITKDITISQSAGSKVYKYGSWTIFNRYYTNASWNTASNPLQINSTEVSHANTTTMYAKLQRSNSYTWNGVGSSTTEYEYGTMSLGSHGMSSASCTFTGSNENGYKIDMRIPDASGSAESYPCILNLSNSVNGLSKWTVNIYREATMIGYIKIQNNRFNDNDAVFIYKDGSEVDNVYPDTSEIAYIPVMGGERIDIYATDGLNSSGYLSFQFIEGSSTSGSLSNVNAKDKVQTAGLVNSYPNVPNTRVSLTGKAGVGDNYTNIASFTFYLENDSTKSWKIVAGAF